MYKRQIVESVKAHNGLITKEDLSSYQVEVLEASSGTYRGYQILSSPLPSSGGAHVIEALNILENFDMSENTDEALRTHRMTEAFKMCFRDRSEFMGDPAYMKVPIEGILSKERAKVLADSIDDQKADNFEMVDPWIYEQDVYKRQGLGYPYLPMRFLKSMWQCTMRQKN